MQHDIGDDKVVILEIELLQIGGKTLMEELEEKKKTREEFKYTIAEF